MYVPLRSFSDIRVYFQAALLSKNRRAEVRNRRGFVNFSSSQRCQVDGSCRAQTPVQRTWDERNSQSNLYLVARLKNV
jgi:hypothetical protein